MRILAIFLFLFVFSASSHASGPQPLVLDSAQQQVTAAFSELDKALANAAKELGNTGITGDGARKTLNSLCSGLSYAIDCCTVDTAGRMVAVEPAAYRRFEGKNISKQLQIVQLVKTKKPVLSRVFRSVEGYEAVDAEYPVFTPDGTFSGSVSVLFSPEKLLGDLIKPIVKGIPAEIWLMEKDGRILYDVDTSQIGLNLFTSRRYQSYGQLVSLGRRIEGFPQGEGSYTFKNNRTGLPVYKKAFWKTVSLYGADWRLVAVHPEPGSETSSGALPGSRETLLDGLKRIASRPVLKGALAKGNRMAALKELKLFYDDTPGIYSVQWVDAKSVNHLGYPIENSLVNYDFHSNKAKSDGQTVAIVDARKPATMEAPLFEERAGIFTFQPVFMGDAYMGMLYTIVLKK